MLPMNPCLMSCLLQKTTTKRSTLDKEKGKKTQKQPTVTIETVNKIFHMKLNLLIHQTAKKIQKTTAMKEKKMLLNKTKRYLQRKM